MPIGILITQEGREKHCWWYVEGAHSSFLSAVKEADKLAMKEIDERGWEKQV